MNLIKSLFPVSLKAKDWTGFFVALIIYVVVNFVGGIVTGLLAKLPLIGFVFGFVGGFLSLYCAIGIIVALLYLFCIIK